MKAEIIVTLHGITEGELLHALQDMRDLERRDPQRVTMFIMVNADELTAEQTIEILNKVQPPLPHLVKISTASVAGHSVNTQ